MNGEADVRALIRKYDVPVPRYTSYPTVPFWDTSEFDHAGWINSVGKSFKESNKGKGISLYIHLPFCESLCTYCACNTRITRDHSVELSYSSSLLKEWELYKQIFAERPALRELHLGGGTPTFFGVANLRNLLQPILADAALHEEFEFSFEGHPNNTTPEHLRMLFQLGFRRVSYGVQDLDLKVQTAIHRIQPFENVERVVEESRKVGYTSVGFDLIYGLPYQTLKSVINTAERVIALRPDRIAFYSYAHVPWLRPGQRGYEVEDLPGDVLKRSLYETGRQLFKSAGYLDIGMDHFALPSDRLSTAQQNGTLHRNFMGYTANHTDLLVGLGASSISDTGCAFAQNRKKVEDYATEIANGQLPVWKGHFQSEQDQLVRRCILDICCKGRLDNRMLSRVSDKVMEDELQVMKKEGLIELTEAGLLVTGIGSIFLRNICSLFDLRMRGHGPETRNCFSKAV